MQYPPSRRTVLLLLALALALVVRAVGFAVPVDPFRAPDSRSFVSLAVSYANEGRLAYEDQGAPGVPLRAFRSLLYPVFLTATGGASGHVGIALVLQALLGVGVVGCVFLIARRAVGPDAALVAAFIGAVYWTSIYFERQILTESLFTFFLAAGVALALVDAGGTEPLAPRTAARVLLAGAVLGLAALTRPVGLAAIGSIAIVWGLALIVSWTRRGAALRSTRVFTMLVCLLLGAAVVVAPAIVRNARVLGRPALLTSGGMNFWAGNGRGTIQDAWRIMQKKLPEKGEVGMDHWFYRDVWNHRGDLLHAAPHLCAAKIWAFFAPSTHEVQYLPLRFLLPFVLIGALVILPGARWLTWLVLAVILSQLAAGLAFVAWPRYRTPIDPFLYLLAAAGLVYLWKRGRSARWAIAALFAVDLVAFLIH